MANVVGMTGGIASGKSTAAGLFVSRGIPVIDADVLARDVVQPGSDGLAAIVEAFGPHFLSADGSLDREKLGAYVFSNDEARGRLNAILHPRIAAESARRIGEAASRPVPYVIYDAALLVENGTYKMFAALVVVRCAPEIQRARLRARNGLDDAEVERRIAAQMPLAEKVAVADYVIDNDGDLRQLEGEVERVDRALRERFAGRTTA